MEFPVEDQSTASGLLEALLAIDRPSGILGESEVCRILRKSQAEPGNRGQTPQKPVFTL